VKVCLNTSLEKYKGSNPLIDWETQGATKLIIASLRQISATDPYFRSSYLYFYLISILGRDCWLRNLYRSGGRIWGVGAKFLVQKPRTLSLIPTVYFYFCMKNNGLLLYTIPTVYYCVLYYVLCIEYILYTKF
jgi:hypothetical protein